MTETRLDSNFYIYFVDTLIEDWMERVLSIWPDATIEDYDDYGGRIVARVKSSMVAAWGVTDMDYSCWIKRP